MRNPQRRPVPSRSSVASRPMIPSLGTSRLNSARCCRTGRRRRTGAVASRIWKPPWVDAGKMTDEARHGTTCIVHSNDPVKARGYMRLAGEIIPVANRATQEEPPPPPSEVPALNVAVSGLTAFTGTLLPPCDRAGRNETYLHGHSYVPPAPTAVPLERPYLLAAHQPNPWPLHQRGALPMSSPKGRPIQWERPKGQREGNRLALRCYKRELHQQ